ncbi:hypothetical protein [Hyphomonas sp.]|uniref:hypothetical protein n=1 Tax=Hyphomonas sp. TaxID=87 RepID=UPI0025B7D5EE|nr:hypothetical protein [Hyphomonas sp.]
MFIPIVTAVILALVFSPVRRALGKLGIGPGLAATLIFVSALSAVALIIYAASDTLAQRLNNAPEIMEQAELEIRELLGKAGIVCFWMSYAFGAGYRMPA